MQIAFLTVGDPARLTGGYHVYFDWGRADGPSHVARLQHPLGVVHEEAGGRRAAQPLRQGVARRREAQVSRSDHVTGEQSRDDGSGRTVHAHGTGADGCGRPDAHTNHNGEIHTQAFSPVWILTVRG